MPTRYFRPSLHFAIGQALVLMLLVSACATPKSLPTQLTAQENNFFSNEYEMIYHIQSLPPLIAARVSHMANPGENFNSSDVFMSGLPYSQLIWAAVSKDLGIVVFRVGGFVLLQYADLYEMQGNQITQITRIMLPVFVDDININNFQEHVLSGKAEILY